MACCSLSCAASSLRSTSRRFQDGEAEIVFDKRKPELYSIYKQDGDYNEHRAFLEDWHRLYEASERNAMRKQANCSSAKADLYQILGLFFVFQGVILTATAQANLLRCHNWTLPFFLCLLASIAAFGASLQKLMDIMEFSKAHRLEKAYYISLQKSIEKLKEEGTKFDIRRGQPELTGRYTEEEFSGKGKVDDVCSGFSRFCSEWIVSYAGAVLLLLSLFSAVTLFSVHQILCYPGPAIGTKP